MKNSKNPQKINKVNYGIENKTGDYETSQARGNNLLLKTTKPPKKALDSLYDFGGKMFSRLPLKIMISAAIFYGITDTVFYFDTKKHIHEKVIGYYDEGLEQYNNLNDILSKH